MHDVLKDEKLKSVVAQMRTLPSVPQLYLEMLDEIKKPDATFKSVGGIIQKDVGMTAKILQMVNSAFFGFYRHITSVDQAVGILGLRMIRSLVLSANVFSQFDAAKLAAFKIEAIMDHSVATGGLARVIVKSHTKDAGMMEDAFTAGLLHDSGKLVLADQMSQEYQQIFATAAEKRIPLCEAEKEKLGVTHAEVGAYLMTLWGLPDPMVEAIAYHHRPAECPNKQFGALAIVHVANVLEHREHKTAEITQGVDMDYLASINVADRMEKWAEMSHVLQRNV